MSSVPDISVVMGVYDGADRLRETMESVLSQEGVSLEFIVIDDESTGVIDGPTHHGSVMFRREAYVRGGRLQSGVLLCSGLGPLVSSSGVFLNDAAHHHAAGAQPLARALVTTHLQAVKSDLALP